MRMSYAVLTLILSLALTGCLAHLTARNVATRLNYQAQNEGNPYRWYVVDLEGDRATLEQGLIGEVAQSKLPDSKKQTVLTKVEEFERARDSTARPLLKEIRSLEDRKNKIVEAWVFDSSGIEITYSIEHVLGTEDLRLVGPWAKHTKTSGSVGGVGARRKHTD